ncbi:MAG: hypothetical protein AB7O97_02655 [Planctomycetota bacterium]
MRHPHLPAVALAALLSSPGLCQLPAGTAAPAFDIDHAWNDGPASFAEFEGKLVILDFAQTW